MAYVYKHFIPQNTAPVGAKEIGVYDNTGKKVCTIPLGGLTPPNSEKLYSFGVFSDIHLFKSDTNWDGNGKFDRALSYLDNQGCAMCIVSGDLTQTGFYDEQSGGGYVLNEAQFAKFKEICDKHTIPVHAICGNHESYYGQPITNNLDKLKTYTGRDVLSYTVQQENDLFILCGQPKDAAVMSDDDFQWLADTLEANKNTRCFVFVHSHIDDNVDGGVEDSGNPAFARENSIFGYWGAAKTADFINLMKQYPNAILFHGHTHIKFEAQEFDRDANFSEENGFKSVHVPSLGAPRTIVSEDGTWTAADSESQGYIVDVYDDCVVLNGMDFVNNRPVPLGVYKIDVPAGEAPSGFPHGYTILDYVQLNNDMAFDTGIVCNQDSKIEITFTREESSARYLFGVSSSDNKASLTGYQSGVNGGSWRFGGAYGRPSVSVGEKHTVVMDKTGLTMNGTRSSYGGTVGTFTTPQTLVIGGCKSASGTIGAVRHIGKIYSFKMYNGDDLILDYVPCINPDGIYGFYDVVGNKFVQPCD